MKFVTLSHNLLKLFIKSTKMEEIRVYHSFWKRLLQSIFYIVSYSALIWISRNL